MGKGKSTQRAEAAEPEVNENPEAAHETGGMTTGIEQEGLAREEGEELPELSKEDQQAAIASSMGGGDQYPYVDRTQIPVHERNSTMESRTEASQAELNPAFTAKEEDGGPVTSEGEGIGTEPNVHDQMLAAAENSGDEDAVQRTQEQIDAGAEQQMDVDKVNAQAEERAPEGVDASTGQKEEA